MQQTQHCSLAWQNYGRSTSSFQQYVCTVTFRGSIPHCRGYFLLVPSDWLFYLAGVNGPLEQSWWIIKISYQGKKNISCCITIKMEDLIHCAATLCMASSALLPRWRDVSLVHVHTIARTATSIRKIHCIFYISATLWQSHFHIAAMLQRVILETHVTREA